MNKNIDLTKILKDCPKGTKLYSSIYGELIYSYTYISPSAAKFVFILPNSNSMFDNTPIKIEYYWNGKYIFNMGECTLFPSKDQRDWSKFTTHWYKKEKFDPNTLKSFDRVLVRDYNNMEWSCDILSHIKQEDPFPYVGIGSEWKCCIPYNDDTKHLVGTTDAAPEFYRYWED